jgi:hypothetical protein
MAADARITQAGAEAEADSDSITFRTTQAGAEVDADTDTAPFRFRVTHVGVEVMYNTARPRSYFQWRS